MPISPVSRVNVQLIGWHELHALKVLIWDTPETMTYESRPQFLAIITHQWVAVQNKWSIYPRRRPPSASANDVICATPTWVRVNAGFDRTRRVGVRTVICEVDLAVNGSRAVCCFRPLQRSYSLHCRQHARHYPHNNGRGPDDNMTQCRVDRRKFRNKYEKKPSFLNRHFIGEAQLRTCK